MWKPSREELLHFPSGADKRYRGDVEARREALRLRSTPPMPTSGYELWPHLVGRGKFGEFPLVVARENYRQRGYAVWFCEPALEKYNDPEFIGFMLLSYPSRRHNAHPAYVRMRDIFGEVTLQRLNAAGDEAKLQMDEGQGSRGGGDPDLFVFRGSERFFVEVKWRDELTEKQRVTFPLIEEYCRTEVVVARIAPRAMVDGAL